VENQRDEGETPAAEDKERVWLRDVYKGDDVPQLTLRAVITGMLLGGLMALSNLYVSLKTGWSLGVTITAGVLAFGFWSMVRLLMPSLRSFGPLENNAMQSVASAAGYMTGGGTVAAIPALMMLTGFRFDALTMGVWIGCLAFLGVFVAIPLKRQLINVEQLTFPSGVAAAETVKSLHAEGAEARQKARILGGSGFVGVLIASLRDGLHLFPEKVAIFGATAAKYTFQVELSMIMVGAGALMGLRTVLSQLAGAVLCYGVLAPWAQAQGGIVGEVKYKNIVAWSVWIGASMMLTAGLLQFFLQWSQVKRAFADVAAIFKAKRQEDDPLERVEVPMSWFVGGVAVFGPLTIFLEWYLFQIPVWMGILTVLLSMMVAIVAARSTGETDTTPTGAMGKLVQLIFGGLHPGNITTNLMSAQVSAGVAIHASDLLTDLKSGHLLGAKPRHQFYAQFFGVIAGSLAVVPVYLLLVPDPSVLGDDRLPAPAAQSWAAVAKLLAQGTSTLHPTARMGLLAGALAGVVLVLAEKALPKWKAYLPSAMGLGLAFTMPAWNSLSMAVGGLLAYSIEKKNPKLAALVIIAAASGLIAGESLAGVGVSLWQALHPSK